MINLRLFFSIAVLFATPLPAQTIQRDSLLDRLAGHWVLRGAMAGKQVVHDVTFTWVLGGEYLEMHEVSRDRTPAGKLTYEAIAYLVHDPHSSEYGVLWLDNTDYNAFLPGGQGHGIAAGDSIPFLFTESPTSHVHNTFVFDRKTRTWAWHIDNDDEKGRRPFARVTLSRR